ncbi:MAG: HAD family hydrolase [Thiotrichales bacterium]
MNYSRDNLLILDADGTTVDAFAAIDRTFAAHGMAIGDLRRFQSRHHLFKYLGGLKEFPGNFKRQISKRKRAQLIATLTEVYREEGRLYDGIAGFVEILLDQKNLRVGVVTRNITDKPIETLKALFRRHGLDANRFDFFIHIPLSQDKIDTFREVRESYRINPARGYVCGDEKKDYLAALGTGLHPFMVAYGFESHARLTAKVGVPPELIAHTPHELAVRVLNGLAIDATAEPRVSVVTNRAPLASVAQAS